MWRLNILYTGTVWSTSIFVDFLLSFSYDTHTLFDELISRYFYATSVKNAYAYLCFCNPILYVGKGGIL